ncbi:histidine--tRNA ligase [cyanobiont of Ornithocercus magnificus]|nr:histidine--tRNA ligase [cyanobiont of Ornithocercus magnificus]
MASLAVERLQSLRGMVDLLPPQITLWQCIEAEARRQFARAAVREIRTPLLEATELFARGIGNTTDIVGKEMYSFHDRGDRGCTLRPEGTASVVRAAIQHGLCSQGPQRLWYGGPMFRYERPQAGRQRQFHQIGVEYLGFADPRSDIEIITLAWDLLLALGVKGLVLEINSLGTHEDRVLYRDRLLAWLKQRQDKLDPESQQRLSRNPLRILDSKHPSTRALLAEAPTLPESLSTQSQKRFEQVQEGLKRLAIPFRLSASLVRGLDYYDHTAFEITSNQLGAQATVCGGGRYNGLVEQLGGPATASVGWALGVERLALLLAASTAPKSLAPEIYIVSRGSAGGTAALLLARDLRQAGRHVEQDLSDAAFSKQLKRAGRSGARWALLIGDAEAAVSEVILRDLRANENAAKDTQVPIAELTARLP